MLIGIGMGGFVDGFARHQIAQWHHMLPNIVPPHTMAAMRVNMTWDGLFHALTGVITLVGVLQLRSAAYARDPIPSAQAFMGQLMLGWGMFNLVEGIIDRQILGICRGSVSICDSHSRTVTLTSFEREVRRHIPGSSIEVNRPSRSTGHEDAP
jgi:uncharacterized membrane protein